MADDITLNQMSGGSVVATDEVNSKHYQYVKPAFGADGTATLVSGSDPLPVGTGLTSQSETGIDANSTSTNGAVLDISDGFRVFLQVDGVTGTHATHTIKVQVSADNADWNDTAITVTGEGSSQGEVFGRYIRYAVTTAEGSASTCDVHVQVK
jgi:exopolysaccharide biosynthesis protein